MNVKNFKKLIKEVVVEAINEEFPKLLLEYNIQNNNSLNENLNFNSSDVIDRGNIRNVLLNRMGINLPNNQVNELKLIDGVDSKGEKINPYLAFIKDAADNMNAQDRVGLKNLD